MWQLILIFFAALTGLWFGGKERPEKKFPVAVYPEKEFPLRERKSFVFVLYAHNQALWCKRTLCSIFEQDYDHYRVIFIDDGSTDQTSEKASQFILDNHQEEKVLLIRNEEEKGRLDCLCRAIDNCLDGEIVIPLDAKDWVSSPLVLNALNAAYQNPDIWIFFGKTIDYPSYETGQTAQSAFYASLFKQKRPVSCETYLSLLTDLAQGRVRKSDAPIAFCNQAGF